MTEAEWGSVGALQALLASPGVALYLEHMPDAGHSPTPTVRGIVMLGLLDWVRRQHGAPGLGELFDRLPSVFSEQYGGPRPTVLGTTPVPAGELASLAAKIIQQWGLPAYHAAAAHVALSDLNGYMRLFLKVGTPTFVLRRLPRVLSHYCSEGALTIEDVGSGTAIVSIRGVDAFGVAIYEGAIGWLRAPDSSSVSAMITRALAVLALSLA